MRFAISRTRYPNKPYPLSEQRGQKVAKERKLLRTWFTINFWTVCSNVKPSAASNLVEDAKTSINESAEKGKAAMITAELRTQSNSRNILIRVCDGIFGCDYVLSMQLIDYVHQKLTE